MRCFEDGGRGHEPVRADALLKPEKTRNKFSPDSSRRNVALQHLYFRFLTSRTVRKLISADLATKFVFICQSGNRKLRPSLLPYFAPFQFPLHLNSHYGLLLVSMLLSSSLPFYKMSDLFFFKPWIDYVIPQRKHSRIPTTF